MHVCLRAQLLTYKKWRKTVDSAELEFYVNNHLNATSIDLSHNNIGDAGVKIICTWIENNRIKFLDLSYNNIKNGIKDLATSMISNTSLVSLDFIGNKIGCGNGLIRFSEILRTHPSLTYLNLSENKIDNKGLRYLVKGLMKNKTLTTLDLFNNEITDEGAGYLEVLLRENKSLTSINLKENKITNRGVRIIERGIRKNKRIREFSINPISISPRSLSRSSSALNRIQHRLKRNKSTQSAPSQIIHYSYYHNYDDDDDDCYDDDDNNNNSDEIYRNSNNDDVDDVDDDYLLFNDNNSMNRSMNNINKLNDKVRKNNSIDKGRYHRLDDYIDRYIDYFFIDPAKKKMNQMMNERKNEESDQEEEVDDSSECDQYLEGCNSENQNQNITKLFTNTLKHFNDKIVNCNSKNNNKKENNININNRNRNTKNKILNSSAINGDNIVTNLINNEGDHHDILFNNNTIYKNSKGSQRRERRREKKRKEKFEVKVNIEEFNQTKIINDYTVNPQIKGGKMIVIGEDNQSNSSLVFDLIHYKSPYRSADSYSLPTSATSRPFAINQMHTFHRSENLKMHWNIFDIRSTNDDLYPYFANDRISKNDVILFLFNSEISDDQLDDQMMIVSDQLLSLRDLNPSSPILLISYTSDRSSENQYKYLPLIQSLHYIGVHNNQIYFVERESKEGVREIYEEIQLISTSPSIGCSFTPSTERLMFFLHYLSVLHPFLSLPLLLHLFLSHVDKQPLFDNNNNPNADDDDNIDIDNNDSEIDEKQNDDEKDQSKKKEIGREEMIEKKLQTIKQDLMILERAGSVFLHNIDQSPIIDDQLFAPLNYQLTDENMDHFDDYFNQFDNHHAVQIIANQQLFVDILEEISVMKNMMMVNGGISIESLLSLITNYLVVYYKNNEQIFRLGFHYVEEKSEIDFYEAKKLAVGGMNMKKIFAEARALIDYCENISLCKTLENLIVFSHSLNAIQCAC